MSDPVDPKANIAEGISTLYRTLSIMARVFGDLGADAVLRPLQDLLKKANPGGEVMDPDIIAGPATDALIISYIFIEVHARKSGSLEYKQVADPLRALILRTMPSVLPELEVQIQKICAA